MKILVVHQNYLMPAQSGGSRFNEMARLWSEAGHEVTVIAGTVDYCSGSKPERYRRRWVVREQDGRVTVWRCYVPGSYGRSYIGRMWAFFAFTLSASSAVLFVGKPDVVIATSPPLVVAVPGWLAARLWARRVPLIFEVRDLWPESAVTTGVLRKDSSLTRALYGIERWITRAADCVNVLTPAYKEDMVARNLASPEKFSLVPNGADLGMFRPADSWDTRKRLGWDGRFVVLYAGAHGRANALHQLLDAAEELRDRPDILIASVGDGPERERLEREAVRRGMRNIRFHGPQPKELMPDVVNACDAGMAVLQNNPTFRTVYPNKIFDYMACAKPTVLAIDGVARKLVCDEARAGVFAEPESGKELSAAIRALADDPDGRKAMGNRGRDWVQANASREALAAKYLDVMRELLPAVSVRPGYGAAKRTLDVISAFLLLAILSPVLIVAMLAVRLTLGSPAVFSQSRLGYRDRPFLSYKLRTMTDRRGADGQLLPDEQRLTALGRFLRASSLDELPQLWNVLKGEMSLVGPRPLMVKYLPRYTSRQRQRHQVMPGITGWAQIHGRNTLDWEERFELDLWYVQNRSLWLDLKILTITVTKVLRRDGVNRPGHATMPEFLGPEAGASSRAAGSGN